ncbi:RING-H2 finger protein ATL11-like [Trifolium pratense]|uniref:RING-H2 finger protein ATL11-like n=1 Tax=Trifolium pratense TaxID=57577 RepID=UPI001E695887|nr:RING-H2 finger protein ATL11-like [Trifolium pratense]
MNTFPLKSHFNFNHAFPYLFLMLLLFFIIILPPPATAQILNTKPPPPPAVDRISKLKFDKSMAIVLVILVAEFFILGFLSVYTRQCAEQRIRGRFDLSIPIVGSNRRHRGLDSEIIETFPTFVYSTVKGHKIGRAALECAVCLNEFQDDETLRLIPNCCHVFHPECIDAWLVNHSTCPVCRANLIPKPGSNFVSIQIPDLDTSDSDDPTRNNTVSETAARDTVIITSRSPSPKVNYSVTPNRARPVRSSSTGFKLGNWLPFPRSHSTGHSLVQEGESHERFTLRLPEEVRNRLMGSSSTPSCGVSFTREGSGRRGYRTRSVGSSAPGRNYEWFNRPDRRGFSCTPPFMGRTGTGSSWLKNKSPGKLDDVGERSSDHLFEGNRV